MSHMYEGCLTERICPLRYAEVINRMVSHNEGAKGITRDGIISLVYAFVSRDEIAAYFSDRNVTDEEIQVAVLNLIVRKGVDSDEHAVLQQAVTTLWWLCALPHVSRALTERSTWELVRRLCWRTYRYFTFFHLVLAHKKPKRGSAERIIKLLECLAQRENCPEESVRNLTRHLREMCEAHFQLSC